MPRGASQPLGTAGLIGRIAIFVLLGIPILAVAWESLNVLLAGEGSPRHILVAIPSIVVLVILWKFLARAVERWDARLHPEPHKGRLP